MNEYPEVHMRVGLTILTMVKYFQDGTEQDAFLFINSIFCLVKVRSKVLA